MQDVQAAGGVALKLDVTEEASMVAAVERILREQGRIDVLINKRRIWANGRSRRRASERRQAPDGGKPYGCCPTHAALFAAHARTEVRQNRKHLVHWWQGDAGYCSSPKSGQGTSLALVGAYILAEELAGSQDHSSGFGKYEARMRPFVEINQALALQAKDEPPSDEAVDRAKNFISI